MHLRTFASIRELGIISEWSVEDPRALLHRSALDSLVLREVAARLGLLMNMEGVAVSALLLLLPLLNT